MFNNENIPIDHLISPENLVTDEITRLIAYPGALQVAHFANNRISIVVVKAYYGGGFGWICTFSISRTYATY